METFSREISALDPWYVTGLAERSASFTFSRSGRQINVYFSMRTTSREGALLDAVQHFFRGAGTIYSAGRSVSKTGSDESASGLLYRVCRRDELLEIAKHFDEHPLQGAKREAYGTWREMVLLKQRFRAPVRGELERLAAELSGRIPRAEKET